MDVSESEWEKKAIENVSMYLNTRGDENLDLLGNKLRNTIGFAMGLSPTPPETNEELKKALEGDYCFYKGKSYEAIEVVRKKVYEYTPNKVYVCVIPIEFYTSGKLYEIPIFRIIDKKNYYRFIDNCGRYYTSFEDFKDNNKLPPGQMLYPKDGHLRSLESDDKVADCYYRDTPSGSTDAKIIKGIDTSVMVAGIGAGVASFFTGGIAIPIIGAVSAVYGLGRSTAQVVDRVQHDDPLNPFTNSEARMIWLGIAANLASFGAMGATMKLGSMASKGKEITDTFKLVVNSINGTSLALNTGATLNNFIFMIDNIDNMSPLDITLQMISIAFWAKGAFTYRTANMIIQDVHNQVFNSVTNRLDDAGKAKINNLRTEFNNDAKLISFMRNSNTDPANTLLILNDLANVYELLDNGKQRLVGFDLLDNGKIQISNQDIQLDMKTLQSLSPNDRSLIVQGLGGFNKQQTEIFNQLRAHINDDVKLFSSIAIHNNLEGCTFKESVGALLKFFTNMQQNTDGKSKGGLVQMKIMQNGQLQIGNKFVFSLDQMKSFENHHVKVIVNGLLGLNDQQANAFKHVMKYYKDTPLLLNWISHTSSRYFQQNQILESFCILNNQGLFNEENKINVQLIPNGPLLLNDSLRIDVCILTRLSNLSDLIALIGKMNINTNSVDKIKGILNAGAIIKMVNSQRIIFEFQLQEAKKWFKDNCSNSIEIKFNHECVRIRTIRDDMFKMDKIYPGFISSAKQLSTYMNARNVSEFGSYSQFLEAYLNFERNKIMTTRANEIKEFNKGKKIQMSPKSYAEMKIKENFAQLVKPENTAKFFKQILKVVVDNKMSLDIDGVSRVTVAKSLNETDLVRIIKTEASNNNIRFGSKVSATYHLAKHALALPSDTSNGMEFDSNRLTSYLNEANATISNPNSTVQVTVNQEGDSRMIMFSLGKNLAVILESNGSIILCSFR